MVLQICQSHSPQILCEIKTPSTECYEILKEMLCDIALSHARVFERHKRSPEGREEAEEDEHLGRPVIDITAEKVKKNIEILRKYRCLIMILMHCVVNSPKTGG